MKTIGKLIIFVFAFLALSASAYAADVSPIFEAIKKGDKARVEALLAKGADVNAKLENGWTPLHAAASEGQKGIVELLLAKGANVDAKTTYGVTPLHEAAFKGHKDVAQLLLAKGADTNVKTNDAETPLDLATSWKRIEVIELLKGHIAQQTRALEEHHKNNPGAAFVELIAQLQKRPGDDALREKTINLVAGMMPAPAIPAEAERLEGRALYAFKNAKSEADMLDAAREYLKAVDAAPWVPDYYFNLCTILEKANRTAEAIRACKFYLIAAPTAPDAGDVRKRVAGLEYMVERMGANMSSRDECVEFSDLYETGAKVANFGASKITVKLISTMYGGVARNQLFIYNINNRRSNFGQLKDLDSIDETFRLDDRVDGTPSYRLTISRDGRVTFGSAGAAQAEIVTSISELHQLRVDQMKRCAVFKKDGKYYVGLGQGGPAKSSIDGALVAGYLMFPSDCSGTLIGDKPGWLPEGFISHGEIAAGAQGFTLEPISKLLF